MIPPLILDDLWCDAGHLRMGQGLLDGLVLETGVSVTCFLSAEPDAGLTFLARSLQVRDRAGRVTLSREVLRAQGVDAARSALAYLVGAAVMGLLPCAGQQASVPLIGVWTAQGVRCSLASLDGITPT